MNKMFNRYRSKTEEEWDIVGETLIQDLFCREIFWSSYEAIKLQLGNAWYKPDFVYLLSDGRIVFVEVKGSKQQKGYRDSRTRQNVASGLYPFVFVEAIYAGNMGFTLEVLESKK